METYELVTDWDGKKSVYAGKSDEILRGRAHNGASKDATSYCYPLQHVEGPATYDIIILLSKCSP
jgi:hypothetical protein